MNDLGGAPSWADFAAAWEIFREPVLTAVVAGALLGFLSAYVVLRRMVFVSAAVSQAAGLGVALSFYSAIHLGVLADPSLGAVALSLLCAAALVWDPRRFGISSEALLGLAFAFAGGAAVIVGARISQEANDIQAILFGTAVLVEHGDFVRVVWTAALVLILHLWWFRGLTFAAFDPTAARIQGLPVKLLDAVILLSIGVAVGVSARALGSLPVFALSTLPATASVMVARGRTWTTFLAAAAIGAAAGGAGDLLSFFRDHPVGASQTVVAVGFVALAFAIRAASTVVQRRRA
jgi:zinc transport system permease protein